MQEHHIPVTRTARYFTLGDPSGRVEEVWFMCHGYAQLAARFLRHCEALADGRRLIVAPEGLSRFYVDQQSRKVGASWMTREDRLAEIADYVGYLDAVYREIGGLVAPSRVRVALLGFSQGAATACRWATMGAVRAERLVVWGGEIPPDLDLSRPEVAERLRALRLMLVYGDRDEFFTPKVIAETEVRLRRHGVPYQLVTYEGGHDIEGTVLKRLAGDR